MTASDRKTFTTIVGLNPTKNDQVTLAKLGMFSSKPRYTVSLENINPLETKRVFNNPNPITCWEKLKSCCRRNR